MDGKEPYWYEAHPDGFACLCQGPEGGPPDVLHVSKAVAVAYTFDGTSGNYITHKHGTPQFVEAWAKQAREALLETLGEGHWLLKELLPRVVSSEAWEVDDLNWVIHNINGLNRLAREKKLEL